MPLAILAKKTTIATIGLTVIIIIGSLAIALTYLKQQPTRGDYTQVNQQDGTTRLNIVGSVVDVKDNTISIKTANKVVRATISKTAYIIITSPDTIGKKSPAYRGATGLGYIKVGDSVTVDSFSERPDGTVVVKTLIVFKK